MNRARVRAFGPKEATVGLQDEKQQEIDAANVAQDAIAKAKRGPRGRKDDEGQAQPINLDIVRDRIDELMVLKTKADDAKARLGDAIKKCSEDSGLYTSAIRKLIQARAGERFSVERERAEQIALLLFEVGEEG